MRDLTDQELLDEERDIALFHSLRKTNSSRFQRQQAWRRVESIRRRRWWLARTQHPLKPEMRWSNLDEKLEGIWTCPYMRTVSDEEVDAMFPGARGLAPYQSKPTRFVVDELYGYYLPRLRLSVKLGALGGCAVWIPEWRMWRVYQRSVKSKPWRQLSPADT